MSPFVRDVWRRQGWYAMYCCFLAATPALLLLILWQWGVLAWWFRGFGPAEIVVTIITVLILGGWQLFSGMVAILETARLRDALHGRG
jgi:hypothetical protein